MSKSARFDSRTRATALEAGIDQRSDGTLIELRKMLDAHLINAWLSALIRREPLAVTRALATEVQRRGLVYRAMDEARQREACPLCGGVLDVVEDGEVDGTPMPFVACSACEFCAVIEATAIVKEVQS